MSYLLEDAFEELCSQLGISPSDVENHPVRGGRLEWLLIKLVQGYLSGGGGGSSSGGGVSIADVDSRISAHNISSNAHSDIRQLISDVLTELRNSLGTRPVLRLLARNTAPDDAIISVFTYGDTTPSSSDPLYVFYTTSSGLHSISGMHAPSDNVTSYSIANVYEYVDRVFVSRDPNLGASSEWLMMVDATPFVGGGGVSGSDTFLSSVSLITAPSGSGMDNFIRFNRNDGTTFDVNVLPLFNYFEHSGLQTSNKRIVGAINELKSAQQNILVNWR
jgi:hypothetical protein